MMIFLITAIENIVDVTKFERRQLRCRRVVTAAAVRRHHRNVVYKYEDIEATIYACI